MKKVAMGLALALAASAFAAHPQTINKEGFVGVNKTHAAHSLGHSKLVFTALGDMTFGNDMFPEGNGGQPIVDYIGVNGNIGLAVGIWQYFDIGVTLPMFADSYKVGEEGDGNLPVYVGNLKVDFKARFPLPEDQVMDLALFGGAAIGTANTEDSKKQGLWVRDVEYISNGEYGLARPYGTKSPSIKFGLAATMDLSKMDGGDGFPFLMHGNVGYRYVLDDNYMSPFFYSVAAEVYFLDNLLSLYAEWYEEIQLDDFDGEWNVSESKDLQMRQLTGALVIHFPVGVDIHVGGSYYMGGERFIPVNIPDRAAGMMTRVNPEYTFTGGLTWSGFLLPQDRDGDGVNDDDDKCPDDFGHRLNQGCPLGNPDADEDGVCDSWVAEKGFQSEFAEVCEGVDMCPNEAGEGEDGCPLGNPDPDEDGVCDAWVAQRKLQNKYKDVCDGIDECPTQAGSPAFNGCPTKQPDPDGDGMCSPWVTDEGVLNEFADVCKGYDMCPGEPGAKANKGCPWDDPDSDNDGMCDEWVTQKKMGYYFEKAAEDDKMKSEWFIEKTCKGIDKCPTEFGPANNEGCPLGNPDTDEDGFCDPWVTEKGMLDQYDGICSGIDQCPTEKGEAFAKGCPMDNPDADGDSLCSSWVTEKGMSKDFANICHGVDKCPAEAGPEWNKGCPAENPDPDQDSLCSPWVKKQNMLDQFKDVCHGIDRCEDEAGPEWNKGCPIDDDPDSDHDGVCSQWVADKKLLDQFKDVCTGIDRCPDTPGDDGHGCPKKAPEKLDGVTFKSGKATLESNAKKILKSVAEKLVKNDEYKDLQIVIQGHTDNVGKEKSNQKLSQQRAESVMKELTKAGVKKNRIKAIGMGSTCPVDDNSTADGREMNRRIEMLFVSPDDDGMSCHSNYVP